jgi:hypothetical protein
MDAASNVPPPTSGAVNCSSSGIAGLAAGGAALGDGAAASLDDGVAPSVEAGAAGGAASVVGATAGLALVVDGAPAEVAPGPVELDCGTAVAAAVPAPDELSSPPHADTTSTHAPAATAARRRLLMSRA